MANFNPQMPLEGLPDWTNVTKPITQPESNKSTAYTLTTIGEGIEGATKIAEEADQGEIKDKVRAGVDALRDTTTLAYQNIRDAKLKGEAPADAAMKTAGFIGSLAPGGPATDVPPGLSTGLDRAEDIGTALAQAGKAKANDTNYTMQLNALAKQLRSEYPGHKDLIDEQISRISGKNPANAYMDNLLQDINRLSTTDNSAKNKLLGKAYEYFGMTDATGNQNIWPYIKAYEHNLPGAEDNLAEFLSKGLSDKYKFDMYEQKRKAKNDWTADDASSAKDQLREELAASAYRNFNGIIKVPGLTNPAQMQTLIQDSMQGKVSLTPDQHNQLLSSAVASRDAWENEAHGIVSQRGYGARIRDDDAVKGLIAGQREQYDRTIELIKNKDYGSLFEAQRRNEAIQTGTIGSLLDDPVMGNWWKLQSAAKATGGDQMVNYLNGLGLQKGYLGRLQSFVNGTTLKAITPDDLRNDGKVKSMYDDIRSMQDAARRGESITPRAYKDVTHNVDILTSPMANPEVKKEVVKYAFDEKNWGLMDAFKKDFTDADGKFHAGKYSVFDTMTTPKITDEIYKLHDPQAWGSYKNWANQSFKTLFGEEIHDLNNITGNRAVPAKVLWNTDDPKHPRFDITFPPQDPRNQNIATVDAQQKQMTQTVNRLNSGLYNLSRVHEKENTDTSTYMLNQLIQLGYEPNSENTIGIPKQIMEAIISSRNPPDISGAYKKGAQ